MSMTALRRLGWTQVAGGALFAAVLYFFGAQSTTASLLFVCVALPTLWQIWYGWRQRQLHPEHSRAWGWFGLAMIAWFSGDAIVTALSFGNATAAELSIGELGYLGFYPFALRALAALPGLGDSRNERWRAKLDATLAALTVGTLFLWIWPLPNTEGISHAWLVRLVHVANPMGDIMLLTGLVVLSSRQTSSGSLRLVRTLMLALAVKTLADTLHARAVIANATALDGMIGALWLSFYGIMSLAVAEERAPKPHTATQRLPLNLSWMPYACVLLAGALLIYVLFSGDIEKARGVAVGAVALSLTVLGRQTLVSAENLRLDRLATTGAAESRLAALVRHSHDVVVVLNAEGTFTYVSPSVERILERDPVDLIGRSGFDVIHPDDVSTMRRMLHRLLESPSRSESVVTRALRGDGSWRELEVIASNRLDTNSIHGIVLNLRDVTERRELEGKLEWQAFHDPMTGLANRILFADRVGHALTRRQRSPYDIGVLFIDLDHFKIVNDTLGHPAGDALLREAARRIASEVRSTDTVARLGGDEFAVLLEDATEEQCRHTAERLLVQLLRAYDVSGREVFSGASIGLTMAEPGVSLDELVRDADVAMYVAKAEGRGRVVTFRASMREEVTDRLALESDLRRALEHGELTVHYQPQVDLRSGEVLGAEALVRWTHPTRGVVPPSRFVPIAEEAGLMVAMSRFVLRTATRDAAAWRLPGHTEPALHVAVNLSGRHVQDPSLVDDVHHALLESGLDTSLLTLEITESVMMHNTRGAIAVLSELKSSGIKIAIDDFGTGYSSLSYLQQFPIDVLKIDKQFIDSLGTGDGDDTLARAILSLGDALGLATVAEGIENMRQLHELLRMGCLLGQGYLLSHPLPARQFADQLRSGNLQRNLEHIAVGSADRRVA